MFRALARIVRQHGGMTRPRLGAVAPRTAAERPRMEFLARRAVSTVTTTPTPAPVSRRPELRHISSTTPLLLSSNMDYEGVPDDVAKLIHQHSKKVQTPVNLQALMRTGRGEFLEKHFEKDKVEEHTATELVLMQVSGVGSEGI